MLYLYIKAPFSTFRTFAAGAYRPSAPIATPSAIYGLLLNLAGVRVHRDRTPVESPAVDIAIGVVGTQLAVQTVYQQLHNFPVSDDKARKAGAFGNKYNITPVRREFLTDLQLCLGVDRNADFEHKVATGVATNPGNRGPLFFGDSNFIVDDIRVLDESLVAYWYRRVGGDAVGVIPGVARLTITIDRADTTQTKSALYAPDAEPSTAPVDAAYWTGVGAAD